MDIRTLLVVGESPSVEPLIDLLHLLYRQQLIEPVLLALPGHDQLVSTAHDPRSPEALSYDVNSFVGGEVDRFTICHMVLADNASTGPSESLAYDIERTVTSAAALVGQELHQRVDLINLLAPAPVEGSVRFRTGLEGDRGAWRNLLLMPEVQERSDLAATPVRLNSEYVAHVVTGLASLLSLWVGQHDGNNDITDVLPLGGSRENWHLVRARSRSLSAPELPDMVLGDITRTILFDAERGDMTLEMVAERDADRAVAQITSVYAQEHQLMAVVPPPAGRGKQEVISIGSFLRLVVGFIMSVPRRIVEEIVSWLIMLKGVLLRQLDRLVQTDSLNFRFSPDSDLPDEPVPAEESERRLSSGSAESKPAMWAELRSVAFGLLDGGDLPDAYRDIVERGSTRFILPDPRYVVAADDAVLPTEPDGHTSAPLPRPDEWTEPPRGLVDGIVYLLHIQHQRSCEISDGLSGEADEIERKHQEEVERRRRRGWIRRMFGFLWRVVRVVLFLALIGAAIVLLPVALPLAGALAVGALIVAQIVLVVAILGWMRRVLIRWFRSSHLRSDQLPAVVDLRRRADIAHRQSERLRQHGEIAREWMAIIQTSIYHPFGPPTVKTNNRIRRAELWLPPSHKVEEAMVSEMRFAGIVSSARRAIFGAGWLSAAYQESSGHAQREHNIRAPGTRFEPDNDRSLPGQRQEGSRASLRRALQSGRAMRAARHDLARRVHAMLATGNELAVGDGPLEDWLFTRTADDAEPSTFLDETLKGDASAWNRSFLRLTTGGANDALDVSRVQIVTRSHHPIPPSLTPEQIEDDQELEFTPFQFRSSVIEVSRDVAESDLTFFSDAPGPVAIDLVEAEDLWRIPPEWDYGDVGELPDDERDRWGIDGTELPDVDDVIGPTGPVQRVADRGQYAFLVEISGRPIVLDKSRIQYKVRSAAAPPNASEIIKWVLQTTADVTGLEFEYAGTREDLPGPNELLDYVFIAWAFKPEYERFETINGHEPGTTIGLGGPDPGSDSWGNIVLRGGSILLNAEMALPYDMVGGPNHALVLLHELGHVLNLAHVPSNREVMHPVIGHGCPETWGPGDKKGLSIIADVALRPQQSAA